MSFVNFNLEDMWDKLRNGEFYFLNAEIFQTLYGKNVKKVVLKLDDIDRCKMFDNSLKAYINTIQICDINTTVESKAKLL